MDRMRGPLKSRSLNALGRLGRPLAFLAAAALLAGAALLPSPDSAEAAPGGPGTTYCRAKIGEYWAVIEVYAKDRDAMCGGEYVGGGVVDILEEVPSDQPEPATSCRTDFNNPNYPWGVKVCTPFYNHDRPTVQGPYCVRTDTGQETGAGCSSRNPGQLHFDGTNYVPTRLAWGDREVGETSATLDVNTDDMPDVRYQASTRHRAVQDGGQCYREWLDRNGDWRQSGSYGSGEEACRRASWNAYLRSEGDHLHNPQSGQFPDGSPPEPES